MQQDRLGRRGRARIIAEDYNHSLSKLVSTKRKVKPSRKAAFMAAFPVKASPRLHSDEEEASVLPLKEASVTHPEHSKTANTNETTSNLEVKSPVEERKTLQVFVRGLLLPKTLCVQLDPETSISDLKALVESESGIKPQDQHLYIGRNFKLCDLLSIRDHGIQQDQNIELRKGGLLGGGPLEDEQSRSIYFLNLSGRLGRKWKNLAINLGFLDEELDAFEYERDLNQQSFKMLNAWWQKQVNPADAAEKLRDALKATGRFDLALQVQDIAGTSFDVKQCAKELAEHYQVTLKVTTHPTERHMSRDMDDIYVRQKLEEETNKPTHSSSETKIQVKTGSQSEHLKASKTDTSDPSKPKPDRDKGFHVQTNSLDSYEDMLGLKTNRLLVRAEAGCGKTTLLKRIAYDWADLKTKDDQTENQKQPEPASVLGSYELVFVVEVNRMGNNFDIIDAIFSQILTDSKLKKKDLEQYIHDNPERVLVLLDGACEISLQKVAKAQCKNGINLNGVLSFKSLKSCKVIVTSRQKTANELLKMHAHYTKINMMGFDDEDRETYVKKYLDDFEPESFLLKVNRSQTLRSLAEIPLFLWLMCHIWAGEGKLPDQMTNLFQDKIQLLFHHKASKEKDTQMSYTQSDVSKLGRIALEGLLDPNGEKLHFVEDEIDSKDMEIFRWGSDIGLLSKKTIVQRVKTVSYFSFMHKIFQEYCAATYLVDLSRDDKGAFDKYLSCIFHGNVESLEYILRFCCGLDTDVAKVIVRRIADLLKQKELNMSLHRISMLLLFEAQSESLIKEFLETGKVAFPYNLQGEVLVAAKYVFKVGSEQTSLHKVDIEEISATCRGLGDLSLLQYIVTHIQCKPTLHLSLHNTSWDSFVDNSTWILKHLNELVVVKCDWNIVKLFPVLSKSNTQRVFFIGINLHDKLSEQNIESFPSLKEFWLANCGLTNSDMEPLFSLLSSAGSIKEVALRGNDLHGLQHFTITGVSSLEKLELYDSGLTKSDIEPLFSLLSSAGSIREVILSENNLHGLQHVKITSLPSLKKLYLYKSCLTKSDVEPLFSLLSSAGSIEKVVLEGNNLHGLQHITITSVPSLQKLYLYESGLTNSDIEPLFSLLPSLGNIKEVFLLRNNLHGLQDVTITSVPSLTKLSLYESGLTKSDIEPLFSILLSAGSIKTVALKGNNLQGLQPVTIASVPSLQELQLLGNSLTERDIEPIFSLLASAGSIKTVVLKGNNLHGLKHVTVTSVPSLEKLCVYECSLTKSDIEPLFSLLSSAGNIKKAFLLGNNLHGLQPVTVASVPSLEELCLYDCSLTKSDIEPLFSLLSSAGSIKRVFLSRNNLHSLEPVAIASVPSLEKLLLHESGLTNSDIEPLFSLLSSAGNIKTVALKGNNLHGLQDVTITRVPLLEELYLHESGLTKSDIVPLFNLLSSAGSVKTVGLTGNNLHGLQPVTIASVRSLERLELVESGLTNSDIEQLFFLLSSAGSIKEIVLSGNNLHGLQHVTIPSVPSLEKMYLNESGLTKSDIEPIFSLLSSSGSIKDIVLNGNNLHGLQPVTIASVPSLERLELIESGLTNSDIEQLFFLLSSAGSIQTVVLHGNDLHGLQPVTIASVPSLEELHLFESSLTKTDIEPLFSCLSSADSIKKVVLLGNNLHGLQHVTIASVPSLETLQLIESGLTNSDIEPLFSLLSSAGSIKQCLLQGNNLHGLQHVTIASVPSLETLQLLESGLTNSDIEPLFSLLSSAGSIKLCLLQGNILHSLQPVTIASVPSLEELHLCNSGLTNSDIDPLFSLLSSAGSIKILGLQGNNLHGLQHVTIASVPTLEELHLYDSGLTNSDIEPLFSLLTAAGSIRKVGLKRNNLHGLQPVTISNVPSLELLELIESGLTNTDIKPLVSLLSSAGSIRQCLLQRNNLHGLQPVSIASVTSLEELHLSESGLTNSDIEPLFSLLSSGGSIKKIVLQGNNLQGLQHVSIASVTTLKELHLCDSGLRNSDIEPLFSVLTAAGSLRTVILKGNNLQGLQNVTIESVPSLKELQLLENGLTNSDIEPLFCLLTSAGSIKKVVLQGNNLHGLQHVTIASVPTLEEFHLYDSGLTNSDIEPLFSLLTAAASIKKVVLKGNNLHGLQTVTITCVPSLEKLELRESCLTNSDIEPLFSLLSSAGSIKTVVLLGNNLHGLQTVTITCVPSLEKLELHECGLTNSDIEPLFSFLSSAGSIKTILLNRNNLHGLQHVAIASVPSLEVLCLSESSLTNSDMEPLFSLLSSAGSIKTVTLHRNNLHGLQPVTIACVSSLEDLYLIESGLTKGDIEPLFSLLSSAGSIKRVVLHENNLHGLQPVTIACVPSLEELLLRESCLTNSDIEPLFSLLSSAGSINILGLQGNNLHGLQHVTIASFQTLEELHLIDSCLTNSDIEPLFSLLSSAGSIKKVCLKGNNLQGLQPVTIARVPSLQELRLLENSLTERDIGPIFSLLASAGSIKTVVLQGNNLHGLQPVTVASVPSLKRLELVESSLTHRDIVPLFCILSSAGGIKQCLVHRKIFHSLQPVTIASVPSLEELEILDSGLTNSDNAPLFSLLSSAGSIKTLYLIENYLFARFATCHD